MNQVTMEGLDLFDWKSQVIISKKLKELARKHEVVITSPYQIDSTGEARFAKGILDAADIAMTMKVHGKDDQKVLEFNLTKIRSGPTMKFASSMNGDTLRISSTPVEIPSSETKEQRKAIKNHKVKEEAVDVSPDAPW